MSSPLLLRAIPSRCGGTLERGVNAMLPSESNCGFPERAPVDQLDELDDVPVGHATTPETVKASAVGRDPELSVVVSVVNRTHGMERAVGSRGEWERTLHHHVAD